MDALNLIINLAAGALGGNVGGAALSKEKNLGFIGNTIAGLIGGPLGTWVATALGILAQSVVVGPEGTAAAAQNIDWGHLIGQIVASGAGGGILSALAGLVKSKL